MTPVKMIGYKEELTKYFTELNVAWLKKYFVVETIDHEILSHPKAYIIDKSGYIFFALIEESVVGTFALIKINDEVYELSKMDVDEAFRGNNIGNTMMQFCITKAKNLKIRKLLLYSNTKLQPAIHLYKKYGFNEVPLDNTEYTRANIKMEIILNNINE